MNILQEVMTFAEATDYLGKSKQYMNDLVKSDKLIENVHYRTAGRIKLIKRNIVESIERGEFKLKEYEKLLIEVKELIGETVRLTDLDDKMIDVLKCQSIYEACLEEMLIKNQSFSYYVDIYNDLFINIDMEYISGELEGFDRDLMVKITDVWMN